MRIVAASAFHVRIPLKGTLKHASYSRTENDTFVVRVRLDDGTEGWGEGLPRPYVTGEDMPQALELLQCLDLPRLLAEPFADLPQAIRLCDALHLPSPPPGHRECFGNSVRAAIEIAILDAACRATGVPLSAVVPLVPETIAVRRSADRVCYSGAVTALGPWKTRVRLWKLRLNGFAQVKVKVGVAGTDDAALLAQVRRTLGPDVELRVDANEAWTCADLESRLAPLVPYGIVSVEQPVPHAESDGLAAVRRRIGTPIMLDESLCSLADARHAIERGTCDLFNVRLSKCGGFLPSLRIVALAHAAGLACQLGCQIGETGILSAAGRHFACAVDGLRALEGSYDRHLVREPLVQEDLTFGYRGAAPALAAPGLSITVDPHAVRRTTVREEHWKFG